MEKHVTSTLTLLVSGIIALGIGSTILFFPTQFYATYNFDPTINIDILNELKAAGFGIGLAGIFGLIGAFNRRFTLLGAVVLSYMYLSYGIGRGLGALIDGPPSPALLAIGVIELLLGLACIWVFFQVHNKKSK